MLLGRVKEKYLYFYWMSMVKKQNEIVLEKGLFLASLKIEKLKEEKKMFELYNLKLNQREYLRKHNLLKPLFFASAL